MLHGQRQSIPSGRDIGYASPGFTWGKSGTVTAGTYLLNDTVPSSLTGRIIPVYNGLVTKMFISVQTATTCTVKLQKRSGASFVDLATITLSAARTNVQTYVGVNLTYQDELAVVVSSGSCSNPVVGAIIEGDGSP
jgi:hypothetical protein